MGRRENNVSREQALWEDENGRMKMAYGNYGTISYIDI